MKSWGVCPLEDKKSNTPKFIFLINHYLSVLEEKKKSKMASAKHDTTLALTYYHSGPYKFHN